MTHTHEEQHTHQTLAEPPRGVGPIPRMRRSYLAAAVLLYRHYLLLVLLLALLPLSIAASAAEPVIPRFTTAGGGATQSDQFTLMGSIGQPVRGLSSSVDFTLNHGFWQTTGNQGPTGSGSTIYLPQVRR
jgi:hypothetical protein